MDKASPSKSRSKQYVMLAGVVIVGLAVWLINTSGNETPAGLVPAAPRSGATMTQWPVPAFSFPDQRGRSVSRQSLLGKVWIADFIETRCTFVCPRMSERVAMLQKQLDDPRVVFVSISIDPESDTADARSRWGETHKLDQDRWHFLGPPNRGEALRLGFAMKVTIRPEDKDRMVHTERFALIDAQGRVRGHYSEPDQESINRLVADCRELLGGTTLPAAKGN